MCSPAARCGWDSVTFPLKTRWGPVKWCFPNLFMSEKHLSCAHRVLRFWTFSQECCYIFYRLDTEGANGYHYIFIAYNPDWAHVRDKVSGNIERMACDVALHCLLSYQSVLVDVELTPPLAPLPTMPLSNRWFTHLLAQL
jgi:hypothetical protein